MNPRRLPFNPAILVMMLLLTLTGLLSGRSMKRVERAIPDIPGYVTLQCDLHTHTVFSDGLVWPTVRVEEAWREGLDALAITDHNEYTPHSSDLPKNVERPYAIAAPQARALGLTLIRGTEITKEIPTGHYNALFLDSVSPTDRKNYIEAVGEAVKQGAFVWWNHPPFRQENADTYWHAAQDSILARGWMHGIEVANGPDYCPEAHAWCLQHNLTMMGNSDIHDVYFMEYDPEHGDRRTITLVFATGRGEKEIREALFAHRTAVLCRDTLYGRTEHLAPLFGAAVELVNPALEISGKGEALLQVRNLTDIPFHLKATDSLAALRFPQSVTLEPRAVSLIRLSSHQDSLSGERELSLPYAVANIHPAPGEPLNAPLAIRVNFIPERKK